MGLSCLESTSQFKRLMTMEHPQSLKTIFLETVSQRRACLLTSSKRLSKNPRTRPHPLLNSRTQTGSTTLSTLCESSTTTRVSLRPWTQASSHWNSSAWLPKSTFRPVKRSKTQSWSGRSCCGLTLLSESLPCSISFWSGKRASFTMLNGSFSTVFTASRLKKYESASETSSSG